MRSELPDRHSCRLKDQYWEHFVVPVRDAFVNAGYDVKAWGEPASAYCVRVEGRDVLIDYADSPIPPMFPRVAKMKACRRHLDLYGDRVRPVPYVLTSQRVLMPMLHDLRSRQAFGPYDYEAQTAGLYDTRHICSKKGFPARQVSYDNNPILRARRLPLENYFLALAASRFMVHISGCYSIDFRFVQAAAIGVPVIATKMLEDYMLPDGTVLKDQGCIVWVEDDADLLDVARSISESERADMQEAMRRLYRDFFEPRMQAKWIVEASR